MNKAEYTATMAVIADGGTVTQDVYDDAVAYAKKAKVKRPAKDAIIAAAPKKGKAKAAKAKAPKEPKVKATCSVDDCDVVSRAGGMCATHYSRLIYRAQPEKAEAAREASKKYAARKRAEKAAAKAEAEKASATTAA